MATPVQSSEAQSAKPDSSREVYYQLFFENNPLPMWVFDTCSLRFLMVNGAAIDLYGYSQEEFLQMTIKDIRPAEEVEELLKVTGGERYNLNKSGEWLHLKKDGTTLYVEVNSHALPNEGDISRRLVVVHNITSRKLAEKQLREAESMASSILQNIVEVVFSFNEKMEMTYISPQCQTFSGYPQERFYQDKNLWYSLVHPKDRILFQKALPLLMQSGEQIQIEYRIINLHGEEKWAISRCTAKMDSMGRMVRVDGSVHDITVRKRAEKRLNFANFSIEKASEAFFWTRPDGQITRVNRAACQLLGYSESELVSLQVFDINPSLDENLWQEHWEKISSEKNLAFETQLTGKDGILHPVEIQSNAFTYDHESYSFNSIREIAERKEAEAEKAILTEKTIRQNEHLQQFAYIVSHNLRAPVANIMGLVDLFNTEDLADPVNAQLIGKLQATSHRLDNTIKDLNEILTIRSRAAQDLEEVDLRQPFKVVMENLANEIAASQATVVVDFYGGTQVLGIKGYVQSIFFNLISNAIKYRSPLRNLQIEIKTVFSDGYLCLQIKDNGLGLDLVKQRPKIFGLYRRFHPHIEGKGLGLHMTKTQIESLGGWIEIESAVGEGTTFKLYFQVLQENE